MPAPLVVPSIAKSPSTTVTCGAAVVPSVTGIAVGAGRTAPALDASAVKSGGRLRVTLGVPPIPLTCSGCSSTGSAAPSGSDIPARVRPLPGVMQPVSIAPS